jgi:hypothetical protein
VPRHPARARCRCGARPTTKPARGCSGPTRHDCTRCRPTSARCGSSKTGLRLRPGKPIRICYGVRMPRARSVPPSP